MHMLILPQSESPRSNPDAEHSTPKPNQLRLRLRLCHWTSDRQQQRSVPSSNRRLYPILSGLAALDRHPTGRKLRDRSWSAR